MIVVDASVVLEVVLRTPAASRVEARLAEAAETLHAPHLIDLEVAQVVRRFCATRELSEERGEEALEDFSALKITRYPHGVLLPRIWELRHNVTAYDGAYIALAEALSAPLLTRDEPLSKAPGHEALIELVW